MIDMYTKMVVLIPCNNIVNATEFAQLTIEHVFNKYAWPSDILLDRDKIFTSFF